MTVLEGNPRDFSGSIFLDECTICGRPTVPVPVGGRFLLVPDQVGGPNPIDSYRVERRPDGALDVRRSGRERLDVRESVLVVPIDKGELVCRRR